MCVGVLCVVMLALMDEAMNLKLCASRHNIDVLKLKMASLILTEQGAAVYGAIAPHPPPLYPCCTSLRSATPA